MEHRRVGWWFKLPGLVQTKLGPNFSHFALERAWVSTRVALTKVPYVILAGVSGHVSTAIRFAERLEKFHNGKKISVDVSVASADEPVIYILMSGVVERDWRTYPSLNNIEYPANIRVPVDRTMRVSPFSVHPQIADVLLKSRLLILSASGSDDVQHAIRLAEALGRSPFRTSKIAVGVKVIGDDNPMIEILLTTIKQEDERPQERDWEWFQQPRAGSSAGSSAGSCSGLQLRSSL